MFTLLKVKPARQLAGLTAALLLSLPLVSSAAVFQAENYSAFFDKTAGNTGNVFRTDAVDIEATLDSGGGYNVGWIDATEWLKFSKLTIPVTGEYLVSVRVASVSGGQVAVDLNGGAIKLGTISFNGTGGWQKWETKTIPVTINAGTYDLGVYAITGGWNFNWIEVTPVAKSSSSSSVKSSSSSSSVSSVPLAGSVLVQAENYSNYNDISTGNAGGAYRPNDNVDIEATTDTGNGFNVGWTSVGEWLEYKVTLAAGTYNVNTRVASNATTGKYSILVDGTSVGSASVGNTGGWQVWKTQAVATITRNTAATYTVRVLVEGADFNLNWIQFESITDVPTCTPSPLCVNKARGEWTLVVIPDTQHYSQNRANAPMANMTKGFDWIVATKNNLNIKFVQGLGDITENWDNKSEWDNASSAWYKLYGQVPFMPVQGNHDSAAALNRYFPISSFSREFWWGGDFGGVENNYGLMTIGKEQYLFLQVQAYDQYSKNSLAGLNWAKTILAANPTKKVILATHDIWATTTIKDNLLTKYDNIVLANAGHDCVRQASYVTTGPRGGVSHNFVNDFQCDAQEVMYMRYYVFKPLEDKVDYYTYSPVLNQFITVSSSQGSFPLVQIDP